MALPFKHGQLIEAAILRLLLLDVFADAGFISEYGRDVFAPRPEVLAQEVLPTAELCSGDVDGTLPLQEPYHLGHGLLRGNREQHVHVVGEEVPLLHHTLLLAR